MKKIKDIFSIEIEVDEEPTFYEREYESSPNEIFIVHAASGQDIELFFAEHEFVQEVRQAIYEGKEDETALEVLYFNDYEDRFDYHGAVAYRDEEGVITWI